MYTLSPSDGSPILIGTMKEFETIVANACEKSADIALNKYISLNEVGLSPKQLVEKLGGDDVITTNTIIQYCNKYEDTTEGLVVFRSQRKLLISEKAFRELINRIGYRKMHKIKSNSIKS